MVQSKTIITMLVCLLSHFSFGQTTTTKTSLRAMTKPLSSTMYRVVENGDTAYYKADYGVTLADDGVTILTSKSGVRFVLYKPAAVSENPTATLLFNPKQYGEVRRLIDSSINANAAYFDSKYFTGKGTKEDAIKIKQ